jgi:hypothetical protein
MLEVANTQLLDLEQEVLVLGKTVERPRTWTATIITGMAVSTNTHQEGCNGRLYMFEPSDHSAFERRSVCRCKHWIIPLDNMGRWAGLPINSAEEMSLWYYDHVDSVTSVDEPADLYRYGENGAVELMSPWSPGTVTATTTVAHLILWAVQLP